MIDVEPKTAAVAAPTIKRDDIPGCLGCAYVFLSYPLNYLFLRNVFIPATIALGTHNSVNKDPKELAFLMLLSPIFFPIEILVLIATAIVAAATHFAELAF